LCVVYSFNSSSEGAPPRSAKRTRSCKIVHGYPENVFSTTQARERVTLLTRHAALGTKDEVDDKERNQPKCGKWSGGGGGCCCSSSGGDKEGDIEDNVGDQIVILRRPSTVLAKLQLLLILLWDKTREKKMPLVLFLGGSVARPFSRSWLVQSRRFFCCCLVFG